MPYKRRVGKHVPICEQMAVPVGGYVVCAFDGITTFVHRGVSPRRIATHSSVDANLSSADPLQGSVLNGTDRAGLAYVSISDRRR